MRRLRNISQINWIMTNGALLLWLRRPMEVGGDRGGLDNDKWLMLLKKHTHEHACIRTRAVLLPNVSDSYKCPDLLFVLLPSVRSSAAGAQM